MNSGERMEDGAREFKTGGEAIMFALDHDLNEVEIFYVFADPKYNFCAGLMSLHPQTRAAALATRESRPRSL